MISLIFAGLLSVCHSYPFGAGLSACKTLIPGHGKDPQPAETLPFMIEPESDTFTPNRIFKGMFIDLLTVGSVLLINSFTSKIPDNIFNKPTVAVSL